MTGTIPAARMAMAAYGRSKVRAIVRPAMVQALNQEGKKRLTADRIAGHRMRTSVEMDEIIAFVCSHCGIAVKSRTA